MNNELLVRVIYNDLSEWRGKPEEFNLSPEKGVLAISINYSHPEGYRHLLGGKDNYYIKGKQYTTFNDDEKEVIMINLLGIGKEKTEFVFVESLSDKYIRKGVWVDDVTMREANKRIFERI